MLFCSVYSAFCGARFQRTALLVSGGKGQSGRAKAASGELRISLPFVYSACAAHNARDCGVRRGAVSPLESPQGLEAPCAACRIRSAK